MKVNYYIFVSCLAVGLGFAKVAFSQTIPAGFPVLEENLRRQQLLGDEELKDFSFGLRPIVSLKQDRFGDLKDSIPTKEKKIQLEILPLLSTTVYNSNRPFGWGNYSMMNSAGIQTLISPGISGKLFFLKFQFRPEYVRSQNKGYQGYGDGFGAGIDRNRFRFWNYGDHPEKFTEEYNSFFWWGQSSVSLDIGPVELGAGTQNIWWGPGQFNSLTFSNNARGMKHFFLRTSKPTDIYIGKLESEIIVGRADDTGILPSQNQEFNILYALPFTGDWKYVTGLSLTYQPVFLPNFFFGFNRTFQQYSDKVENTFIGRFPIFQSFQKKNFFQDNHSIDYDANGQDQQIALSVRYLNSKANIELYAEYGKRDHNYDWREFIMNPEHARAYLFGFSKLVKTGKEHVQYQIRGELVHQQESVNRYVRYEILNSFNATWHTHYQARGFTNEGQSMGVGIGVGGNVQMLEFSRISGLNKIGLLVQRLENHQDFFYGSFEGYQEKKPWIDLTMGLLWDHQWERFILSSKTQLTRATNYQWENAADSKPDFPIGQQLWTFSGTLSLIYQFQK
ncbi:hypothetical protein J2X69_002894 [Algoriphagus sp. 4150]|uniref:capsule assembly Wzi family protein n=1 Tax=Algoriphagus sp. 4150 TaxID=2817756 RepID=UPI0028553AFE|nr:capsule assembly Wzi family protein [Algoriphagus sp. 4150]MDR7130538.1 hypothetical protein [Algoriphagus sp. 4150]